MFPTFISETTRSRFGWLWFVLALVGLAVNTPTDGAHPVVAQELGNQSFVVYAVENKTAADIQKLLAPLLPSDDSVRVIVDATKNQILVSADPSVQRIVKDFLAKIDRPAAPVEPAEPVIKMYRVPSEGLSELAEQLSRRFSQRGLRVSVDREQNVLLVMAVPEIHMEVDRLLQSSRNTGVDSANSTSSNSQPVPQMVALTIRRIVPLPRGAVETMFDEIVQLFRTRLEWQPDQPDRFCVVTSAGQKLVVSLDRERAALLVEGEESLVAQFETLVDALARNRFDTRQKAQVLLLQREAQQQLEPYLPDDHSSDQSQVQGRGIPARPIAFQQSSSNGAALPQEDRPSGRPLPLGQFEGVEIDTLPDLDVIILKGRDQELEQLSEIIRQLEQISRDTQAEIRILPLRHVASEQLAEIIGEAQEDLVGARQGRVSVTPLGKPNALLLIGWGEAVTGVIDLAKKLDRPVEPQTQFAVFRLKHATAAEVDQTLQSFFTNREGLGVSFDSAVDSRTNSIVVYASPRDLDEIELMIIRLDVPRGEKVRQARVFPVENSLAADVADVLEQAIQAATTGDTGASLELLTLNEEGQRLLRSGVLADVQVTVNPRNNSLIITSSAENFELIEGLLEQLDTPGMTSKIKIFPVTNGDAASLVETLRSLIPSQVGGNSDLQLSSAPGEMNLSPLRFTVDVRSNSIIATGSEGDLRIVEMLILRLDEEDSMQRKTSVYLLKNAPAVDVALAVNEFLRNKRQVEDAGPGDVNPFQQLEKEVVVVPEPVANKLILSATPRYFDEIEELIEKLDEQPPEVVIQVLIAEVEIGEANEFGVELGIQDSVLFDRSLLGDLETTENSTQFTNQNGVTTVLQEIIQAASNLPGFDFNSIGPLGNSGSDRSISTADRLGGQGISNFQVGRSNEQLGFGGLVLSASSQNISVLVRALQENNQLEILSRPQIRTLDNQPAFIQVGERVPRITSSQVSVNGQTNQVILENVGLILGVTPRISPTGTVVMEIDAEKSDLGPESKGIPVSVSLNGTVVRSPRIETTTAQATVSAADGETVILGGLITKKTHEIHRKVPVLGEIPLLSNLFRFDSVITTRSELLIILTPKVIRNAKDNERLKQAEMARMSWCAADVYDMQGDIDYMIDPGLLLPSEAETEVIYPDQDPRGTSSRRSTLDGPPIPPEPDDTRSNLIPLNPGRESSAIGSGVGVRPLPPSESRVLQPAEEVRPAGWENIPDSRVEETSQGSVLESIPNRNQLFRPRASTVTQ